MASQGLGHVRPLRSVHRDWRAVEEHAAASRLEWEARDFRRAPLAALTIVLTVAIGLGLVTIVFTFYNAWYLQSDAIRDPGNLGTILRAAAASGTQAVLLSPDCVDAWNPKVLRAGMGAHFRVPLATLEWAQIAAYCAALPVYLADSTGDLRYDQANWRAAWGLIIGGEAHGAGEQAAQIAQARVMIPMAAQTESLNAAMAAS